MKRFTMILALLLMAAMPMMAERVSPETARKVAMTFMNNNGAKAAQLTDLTKEAGFPNLYIFSAEQGFVVMAADDCVQPILGYSLNGSFLADDMPDNVRGWLQGYNDEIQFAKESKMKASTESAQLWKALTEGKGGIAKATTVVAPLIQTKWNQNKYYNNLCPAISDGPEGHAYTGCVATAMAQIMKYWEYPSHGIGSHSYTWNNQTESADFGATTYDWGNMVNYYNYYYSTGTGSPTWLNNNPSTAQLTAVATLMYHCGVSVDMIYGGNSTGGSAAATAYVANALKTYFNYSPELVYREKSAYSDDEWKTLVKTELNANRPLQYSGHDSSTGGGHSFVCDGYDNSDYFHFNWGWSGAYDGYFSLSNLNTGANNQSGQGNGIYTDSQAAIFGIQPVQCSASDPANLTYTLNGLQNLTLSWTAANGAVSYNIYRNGNYVGSSTTNSYTETAPFGNNVYYVRSVDVSGNLSLSSNSVSLYIGYQTPVVNDLEGSLDGNDVQLSWTAPEWCYPETESAKLNYGEGSVYYSWTSVYYAHRHLAANLAQYAGKAVYKVSTYILYPGTYSVYIYTKSTQSNRPDPNSLAFSNVGVTVTIANGWYEFDTDGPIILTGTDDLWVVMKQENTGQTYAVPSFNLSEHNTNAFYAGSNSPTSLSDAHSGYNCAWLINTYLTDGTYTYNLYQDGTRIAQNLSQTTCNATLNNNAANLFTVKTNYYGGETSDSNKVGFVKGNVSLATLSLGNNDQMTVTEDSQLTVSGTLSNTNADHFILENGAQLINSSDGVCATVKKNIAAYTEGEDNGWHLISSPVVEGVIPDESNGLISNDFDLYAFNQSEPLEWRNYEAQNFTIDNKSGYLYANSGNPTLSFVGTLAASVEPTELTYDADAEFDGFNLIGNPYPCNASVTGRTFYVLQEGENGSEFVLGSNPIAPCAAILVQAQREDEKVTFNKTATKGESGITLTMSKANTRGENVIDKARISFNSNHRLAKFNLRKNSSKLYIPQNGQDFAVACADGENEMPVNFKAAQNGTYTLGVDAEGLELGYLHLIDNLTGADIDLLALRQAQEPASINPEAVIAGEDPQSPALSYTFTAKVTDYPSRFKLLFAPVCGDADGDDEMFAYYANGEIRLVETQNLASLQIVDMMGRIVMEREAINRVSTEGMVPGVYVLRLINGEKVKTQKMVIE